VWRQRGPEDMHSVQKRHSSETHFLNVDLDIYSKHDLSPLVQCFGSKVLVLRAGRERRKYSAHLEIAKLTKTPDSTIRAFCKLVEALSEQDRALWNTAIVRSFSIGIQAGAQPNPCDFRIQQKTVKAICDISAEIVLTIYPPAARRLAES
jgi:hypothetical protein